MALVQAFSSQRWRVTVVCTSAPSLVTAAWSIAPKDGGPSTVAIASIFQNGPAGQNSAELTLTEPLEPGVLYTVTGQSSSLDVAFYQPQADPALDPEEDDPEAEVFGVDIDWLFGGLTADGDAEQIRGEQCLIEDCATVVELMPGELAHKPTDGIGAPERVNGPLSLAEIRQLRGAAVAQWQKDDRVQDVAAVEITQTTTGEIEIAGLIKSVALTRQTSVKST